jgi:hypothetical protein
VVDIAHQIDEQIRRRPGRLHPGAGSSVIRHT